MTKSRAVGSGRPASASFWTRIQTPNQVSLGGGSVLLPARAMRFARSSGSLGLSSRDCWTWYFRPPIVAYPPSGPASSPAVAGSRPLAPEALSLPCSPLVSLFPHAPRARATARIDRIVNRRRRMAFGGLSSAGRVVELAGGLAGAAGERHLAAAALVVLEDRAPAAPGAAEAPPRPAATGDRPDNPIRPQRRLRGDGEAHASRAGVDGVELPHGARADPVVLAGATGGDDPPRVLDLDEGQVAPREALQRREEAKARARAVADGVLAGEVPVDHEVVEELRVVGDVGEVGEDLLARTGDGDLHFDGVHGADDVRPPGRATTSRHAGAQANRLAALAVV